MNFTLTMLAWCMPYSMNLNDLYFRDKPPIDCSQVAKNTKLTAPGTVIFVGRQCVTIERSKDKYLTFRYAKNLLEGKVDPNVGDCYSYLPTDLQVGDTVRLRNCYVNKQQLTDAIYLVCRLNFAPIPPSQNPDPKTPYHIIQNAMYGWKYKGIAIPDNILKQYGLKEHPPQPQWMKEGKPAPFK